MKKRNRHEKFIKILIVTLFLVNAFLYVYAGGMGGSDMVGGDEVASYSSLMPFLHGIAQGKFVPSFLVYYHEPLQQLVQIPVVFFGASTLFVRLPNIFFGILTFIVLLKIGRRLFGSGSWYSVFLLVMYTFSGFLGVLRMGIDAALFNLILALSLMYWIDFKKNKKNINFQKSVLLLVLNLFVFIDGIFVFAFALLGGTRAVKDNLKRMTNMWQPLLVALFAFGSWAAAVYIGSVWSKMYDWHLQAPFRLFSRGTSYSLSSISSNVSFFLTYNSIEFTILLLTLLFVSVFDKKSRIIWFFLLLPFIYFNLVKMPTLHILNFWVLIILAAVLGIRFICERSKLLNIIFVFLVTLSLFRNIQQIRIRDPFVVDANYKAAATYIRNNTSVCDKVSTNIDGYTFRFYFNRGYTQLIDRGAKYLVIRGASDLNIDGYGVVAITAREPQNRLVIYLKDYSGPTTPLESIDKNLFSYENTISYVNKCRL